MHRYLVYPQVPPEFGSEQNGLLCCRPPSRFGRSLQKMVYTTLQFANTNTTCRHFNGSGRFPRKIGKLQ